jgi:hypothetical protein
VCRGEIADFNFGEGYGGELDPKKPEGWPPNRVLRLEFLETILLREPYCSAVPHQGIRITGGWFKKPLELSNATLAYGVWLEKSRFDADVALIDLRSSYVISLDKSVFTGQLDMESLQTASSFFMGGADFSKVRLVGAHIGGAFDMAGSTFTDTLNMNSLKVGSHLFMRDKAQFRAVDLRGAHIGGALDMAGSTFTGALNMDSLKVGSTLSIRDKAQFSEVILRNAHIEGQVTMNSSTFTGALNMEGLQVGDVLIMADAIVTNPSRINLTFAKIALGLDLSANSLPSLDLTSTQVGGEFRLGWNTPLTWQPDATLVLRNTTVGSLQILPNAWPHTLELDGFTYASLGWSDTDGMRDMGNRQIAWLEGWLAKQSRYSPHCYEHLASILEKAGRKDDARAIRYTSRERERSNAKGFQWWLLTGLKTTIGYGYRYQYTLYWTIGWVAIGMLVLAISHLEPWGRKPASLREGVSYTLDIFFYSLGKLLPIVKLDKRYDEPIPVHWVQYYFYIHQLIGYVLAFFLIAGLTGLTK